MTNIVFDMRRTGATIAALRRERNMTQMQLADEMDVSFQAVSNWERGQSMPDIGKLPQLAGLFGTTIDHLLGKSSPVIEAALAGTLAAVSITPQGLAEAAPLLTPLQVDQAADALTDLPLDDVTLATLLPFLSTEKVDDMARLLIDQGKDADECLPFMSEDAIDDMARAIAGQGRDVSVFLPFMSEDAVSQAAYALHSQGRSFSSLLPFMDEEDVDTLAIALLKSRQSIDELMPFISDVLTNRLADLLSGKA